MYYCFYVRKPKICYFLFQSQEEASLPPRGIAPQPCHPSHQHMGINGVGFSGGLVTGPSTSSNIVPGPANSNMMTSVPGTSMPGPGPSSSSAHPHSTGNEAVKLGPGGSGVSAGGGAAGGGMNGVADDASSGYGSPDSLTLEDR